MDSRGGKRIGAGRKRGYASLEHEKARDMLAIKLAKEFGPIADKAIEQAKNGDSDARKWLMDRAYGRPKESMDMNIESAFSLKGLAELRLEQREKEALPSSRNTH